MPFEPAVIEGGMPRPLIVPDRFVVLDVGRMRLEVNANVMSDRWLARANLHRGDPGVLGDPARHRDVGPFDHVVVRVSRHRRHRPIHDQIRLDLPTLRRPLDWRRSILGVAFRSSRVGPLGDGFDRALVERPVVGEMSEPCVRKPGRHLPRQDCGLHSFGPRPGALISQEGHRRHLPWAVTALAILLEDRQDVLVERDRLTTVGTHSPDDH